MVIVLSTFGIMMALTGCEPNRDVLLGQIPGYGLSTTGSFLNELTLPVPGPGRSTTVYVQRGTLLDSEHSIQKDLPFCAVSVRDVHFRSPLIAKLGIPTVTLPKATTFWSRNSADVELSRKDGSIQFKASFDIRVETVLDRAVLSSMLKCSRGGSSGSTDDTLRMNVGEVIDILGFKFEAEAPRM